MILGFTNNFKTYGALLLLHICACTHYRKADLLAVELAQSFLGAQVQLKFSHPKEKPVLYFLGQEGERLGNTLQGQAHAFAAVGRQKTTDGAQVFLTLSRKPTTSHCPSHWYSNRNSGNSFQLLTAWVMPPVLGEDKAGGHQASKGKRQGHEFLLHQLRSTKTVLCNLIFFSLQKFPDLPHAFLPSSKQWKQSRLLLADRIGPAHRRIRGKQFCTTSVICHFSRFSSCRISENRRVIFGHLNSFTLVCSGSC